MFGSDNQLRCKLMSVSGAGPNDDAEDEDDDDVDDEDDNDDNYDEDHFFYRKISK